MRHKCSCGHFRGEHRECIYCCGGLVDIEFKKCLCPDCSCSHYEESNVRKTINHSHAAY